MQKRVCKSEYAKSEHPMDIPIPRIPKTPNKIFFLGVTGVDSFFNSFKKCIMGDMSTA